MNIRSVIVQYVAYTTTSYPCNLYRDSGIHDFEPMGAFYKKSRDIWVLLMERDRNRT